MREIFSPAAKKKNNGLNAAAAPHHRVAVLLHDSHPKEQAGTAALACYCLPDDLMAAKAWFARTALARTRDDSAERSDGPAQA
jgi:hypothetical protein